MKFIFNNKIIDSADPCLEKLNLAPEQSVFETFKICGGLKPGTLMQHWNRLFSSAEALGLAIPLELDQNQLDKALDQLLATTDLSQNYRCKVLMSANFWWIQLTVLIPLERSIYTLGVVVDDALEERSFPMAKWSWPNYQKYFDHQKQQQVFETLFFDSSDILLEGNITSVIAVINGVLVSPEKNVLPGITVRTVFEKAQHNQLKTSFRSLSRAELKTASEIILTNAIKGLVPVRAWHDWQRSSTQVYDQLKQL
jgi:branched-chain amino acid aminotransferase